MENVGDTKKELTCDKDEGITFSEGERGAWKNQLCYEGAKKEWGRRLGYGKGLQLARLATR